MVTITIYGLDQYTVGHYSKDHTKNLADLFEVDEDDINFAAPEAFVIHKGVEQTSWNAIVKVNAPQDLEPLQEKIAHYLINTLKDFSIHLSVEFTYYHRHDRYESINDDYPRFLDESNLVNIEDEELPEGEELYEGNIFEGYQEQLDEIYKEK